MKPLKFTVVGDGMVGKTCLLYTYVQNSYPEPYIPTVFDNQACMITVDGKEYRLTLWDTAGQESYDRLRPLSYSNTNCFIICYSIDSKDSFSNISSKWMKEIKHFAPQTNFILVATKSDLRIKGSDMFVTEAEGKRLKTKIGAKSFVECSARLRNNLDAVFEEAVRAAESKIETKVCSIF